MTTVAGMVVMGVLLASFLLWSRRLLGRSPLQERVPLSNSDPVPWGLVDLGIGMAIWLAVNVSLAAAMQAILQLPRDVVSLEALSPSQQIPLIWIQAGGSLGLCLLILAALWLRYRVRLSELGWAWSEARGDVALGVQAFIMLAPIVYGIQIALTQFVESRHPLIEMLKANPDPAFFLAVGFTAVIVAPLTEEFLFRVLLQGWLERVYRAPTWTDPLLHGGREEDVSPVPGTDPLNSLKEVGPFTDLSGETPASAETRRRTGGLGPILISAACFALAHWQHGPDPVPLFVLAVGLGYLYQRTGRVLPCILLHLLLNLCSLAALWLAVTSPTD